MSPSSTQAIKKNIKQAGVELELTQAETVSLELDLIKGLTKLAEAVLDSNLRLRPDITFNKVALDLGQLKLYYVKPIPAKSETPWIIFFLWIEHVCQILAS